MALVVVAMAVSAARAQRRGRYRAAAATLIAGMVALVVVARIAALPACERIKAPPRLAAAIRAADAGAPVATLRWFEPSLLFYLDRPIERLADAAAARAWLARGGAGVLVVEAREAPRVADALAGLRVVARVDGFDYAVGRSVALTAYARE